jgi:hypothetical protein
MATKTSLRLVLALGLLHLCSSATAAQVQAQAEGFVSDELIWLVGAVILGVCVIARRRPLTNSNRESTSESDTSTSRPEQWETRGAAS